MDDLELLVARCDRLALKRSERGGYYGIVSFIGEGCNRSHVAGSYHGIMGLIKEHEIAATGASEIKNSPGSVDLIYKAIRAKRLNPEDYSYSLTAIKGLPILLSVELKYARKNRSFSCAFNGKEFNLEAIVEELCEILPGTNAGAKEANA